tara:strand:+ start:2059 stop:2592 length:534 start_codon:yes stop_codon:yes gene_type:complete
MKIGDLIAFDEISIDSHYNSYHKSIFWPDWFDIKIIDFKHQVIDMASPNKPFKATDTFKIQAGYPHEVMAEQQENINTKGIKRDSLSNKYGITIPKLTATTFLNCVSTTIAFTTPKESQFIRDIIIVDDTLHDEISFVYVVSRKAQIITAWAEKKKNKQYILKKPYGIFKIANYVKE